MDKFKKIIAIRKGVTGLKSYSWRGEKGIVRRIARRVLRQEMKATIEESK